jgi:hypothetical protein
MAPVKTFMMALCCGVVLWGTVSAHAIIKANGLTENGVSLNGLQMNGLHVNGRTPQGLTTHRLTAHGFAAGKGAPVEGPQDGLPFILISRQALGKTHP